MLKNILLVGLGGGAGSIGRYLLQRWLHNIYPHHFPWGTFAVNVTGCFLIGLFWAISFKSFDTNENWKLLLMTGLCGGFTTFSAFTLEGIGLIREQRLGLFFLYAAGSIILGLLATYSGMKLIR
ncbi:MAG: fluoride efflux transporter CrcB [Chitinophagaceae bacterium]|nr:fluoride efflux transporter CrcB [Chitinophagaceae bacterium]MBK8952592.1 fluoride efflux transporter CrcB [Chitinophagaceae bacterium]